MIEDIQAEMGKQFSSRKLELFTLQLNIADMAKWAEGVAKKHNLDKHDFQYGIKELFWAVGTIQLDIGHALIAMKECPYPSGKNGIALKEKEIPEVNLSDLHFWHHVYNCYEAIYRFWERCVMVLKMRLTPQLKGKYYFDGYVNFLGKCDGVSSLKEVKDLKKYLKSWGKISCKRNEISHGKSNPFLNMSIEVTFSGLSDYLGKPLAKYEYQLPNLKQEIETIINYYRKSFELLYSVKSVCDLQTEPNKSIQLGQPPSSAAS